MEVTETSKGKPSAHYDGYAYRKYRTNKDGVETWVCLQEKTTRCKGRLISKNSDVLKVTDHQCIPDPAKLEVKKAVSITKKRAREDDLQIPKIFSNEMGDLFNRGYEFVTEIPVYSSMKSSLYRIRQQSQGIQQGPQTRDEIELKEDMLKMLDGSSFLLADDGKEDRIIVLASNNGKESLKTFHNFFMDGTFRSCSKLFKQIYTIHADIGSTRETTNVIPVVFALLPDKKKTTYIRLFRLILTAIPEWTPETVTVDFEGAAISALREVFPVANIAGCNFHMNQCLWRKIQELGLTKDYKENETVRLHIRMTAALAFLKPEDIVDGWLIIMEDAPNTTKVQEYFSYFVDQWLENDQVPIEMWNCFERRHRTNNAVEGWNYKLNSLLANPHPHIKYLIACLKKEAEHSNHLFLRQELNLENKKRKKCYIKIDNRIQKNTEEYKKTGNIRKCLKALSFIQKLE